MIRSPRPAPLPPLSFAPSRVEGLPDVKRVVVHPDRLELLSGGRWVVVRFDEVARWTYPRYVRRFLARLGWRPDWLPVGARDWFHPPRDRFFRFFTKPPLTIYLVDEDRAIGYGETLLRRIEEVIESGGFATGDLG